MLSTGFVTERHVLGKVFPTQADSNKCQQNIREGTTPGHDAPKWDGQVKSWICHAQVQVLSVSLRVIWNLKLGCSLVGGPNPGSTCVLFTPATYKHSFTNTTNSPDNLQCENKYFNTIIFLFKSSKGLDIKNLNYKISSILFLETVKSLHC